MKGFFADCRHAVRLYIRTPGASLIAVLVLAVGMAFVGAFLSLYVDLALRPHPGFEQGARIATIARSDGTRLRRIYFGIERIAEELAAVGAFAAAIDLSAEVGPERESRTIEMVSAQFFDGLGPRLALGHGFERADHVPEAEPVAVISYRYWQDELGGDPGVLGTRLEIDREQRTMFMIGRDGELSMMEEPDRDAIAFRIVGVMAEALPGVAAPETALWLPLEGAGGLLLDQVDRSMQLTISAYIRRAPGVSMEALVGELDARAADEDSVFSLARGPRAVAIEGVVRDINVQRDAKRQLELFLAGSVLLALVAAANVSLFLLARAPGRRRELGIRIAVGARLNRLARQLASEASLLVAAAAVLGLMLSIWLGAYLRNLAFLRQAEWRDVSLLDWRVLALVGIFLLLLAVLVSLAPVLGLKRRGIAASSRQVAARATLAQRIAGTAQIAIAGALGGAAVAFGWYLGSLTLTDPGYATENRYAIEISFAQNPNASVDDLRRALEQGLVESRRRRDAIEALPGIGAAALGRPIPGVQTDMRWGNVPDPSDPAREIEVREGAIDSHFVDVLGLTLIHGRAPEENEADVMLVNRTLARLLWGRDNVVGEILSSPVGGQPREIVGVLEDLSFEHPSATVPPFAFVTGYVLQTVVVETSLSAAALRRALAEVGGGDFNIEAGNVRPLQGLRDELIAPDRARSLLTIATASLVVFLAAFGFYGTQRYLVAAGRREYAIRASLGAGPRALGRLVFRRGLLLSLPGLVVGGLLAFIAVAWLRDDLVSREISPALVTLCVVAGLSSLMLAASVGPAREAKRTQPAPLLRED